MSTNRPLPLSRFKVGETVRVTKHATNAPDFLKELWGKIESTDIRGRLWHYEINFGEELGVHTLPINCIDQRSKPTDWGSRR